MPLPLTIVLTLFEKAVSIAVAFHVPRTTVPTESVLRTLSLVASADAATEVSTEIVLLADKSPPPESGEFVEIVMLVKGTPLTYNESVLPFTV